MANSNPPVKGQAYTTRFFLVDMNISGSFKANPTLATGDFKVDIDGAGFNNLSGSSSVAVSPSGGVAVLLTLQASDMNGDVITVTGIDQTSPKEWCDFGLVLNTTVLGESSVVHTGTATAGDSTHLTLDAGASTVNSYYNGATILWTSGANIGVLRTITGYVGSTKVATFAVALPAAADATPTFAIKATRMALPGTDGKALISTDTQDLSGSLTVLSSAVTGAVGSVTGNVGGNVGGNVVGSVASVTAAVALTSAYDFAKGTVAMTESYAADGATMTPAQAFYQIWSLLAERNLATTTLTTKKLDGSTTSMTFTLDSATSPTSQTRST